MTASRLGIYNDALGTYLGERKLASLTENREPRRACDDVYATVLNECLEDGYWRFARRTVQLTASSTVIPAFGYEYAFDIPSDMLDIFMISMQPNGGPFNDYVNESGFIRAHIDTLYITYISNDPAYGLTLELWAPSFARYVAAALAARICLRITQSEAKTDRAEKAARALKHKAESINARNGPTLQLPSGSWVTSRRRSGIFNGAREN